MHPGLWKFDDLIKELLVVDSGNETDQELVDIKSIDTSNLWRLAYLNVKVLIPVQVTTLQKC